MDSIVIIGATSTSIKLTIVSFGLIILPIAARIVCAVSLGRKVLHKSVMNKNNNNKKQYEKDQQAKKTFDKPYRKPLQDNVIDKNEYESLIYVNFLLNIWMK